MVERRTLEETRDLFKHHDSSETGENLFFAYLVANVVKLRSKRERREMEDEVLREMEVVELQCSERRKTGFISYLMHSLHSLSFCTRNGIHYVVKLSTQEVRHIEKGASRICCKWTPISHHPRRILY